MRLSKPVLAWLLSLALAGGIVFTPKEAHAEVDIAKPLPVLIFAAALTTFMVVYAVNNPGSASSGSGSSTDDTTDDDSTTTTTSLSQRVQVPIFAIRGEF